MPEYRQNIVLKLDACQSENGRLQDVHVASIFKTTIETGCKLTELHLSNMRTLHPTSYDDDTIATFHKDLKTFYLCSWEDDIKSQVKRAWAGGPQLIKSILRDADLLELLAVSVASQGHGFRVYDGIALGFRQIYYSHFMKPTLSANKFSALREIDLYGVDVDTEDLRTVLFNCRKTDAWTTILELFLTACYKLDRLNLDMLSERSQLVIDTTRTAHVSYAKLYQAATSEKHSREVLWEGREAVLEGLTRNVERGITFHTY